jgi:hypothetical protein
MFDRLRACAPVIAVLLCFVVLTLRISGVHAHRHMDAHAAPALHDHHHDHDHGVDAHSHHVSAFIDLQHESPGEPSTSVVDHVDVSVDGSLTTLDRLIKLDLPVVALLFAFWLLLLLVPNQVQAPPHRPRASPEPRSHLRPLLRGPPPVSVV